MTDTRRQLQEHRTVPGAILLLIQDLELVLGHMVSVRVFTEWLYHFTFPPFMEHSVFPYPCQHFVLSCFLSLAVLVSVL